MGKAAAEGSVWLLVEDSDRGPRPKANTMQDAYHNEYDSSNSSYEGGRQSNSKASPTDQSPDQHNNNHDTNHNNPPPNSTNSRPEAADEVDDDGSHFIVEGLGDVTQSRMGEWTVEVRERHAGYLLRPRSKSSLAWKAFMMTTDDHPIPAERGRACCNFCGITINVSHGVSGLGRHLAHCKHPGGHAFHRHWKSIKTEEGASSANKSSTPRPRKHARTAQTLLHFSESRNSNHGNTMESSSKPSLPNPSVEMEYLYSARKRLYADTESEQYNNNKRFRDATERSIRNIENRIDAMERGG